MPTVFSCCTPTYVVQDQDCFGGCFDASNAWVGELAVVRVWRRVVGAEEVRRNMAKTRPDDTQELAALYVFDSAGEITVCHVL